jgi:hypothetical protein
MGFMVCVTAGGPKAHHPGAMQLPRAAFHSTTPAARLVARSACSSAGHANIRSHMTSHGSPYARFQRALRIGRLSMVRAAAAELPRIDLDDALAICLLIERQDGERYERAVVRWLARLATEVPAVGIDDLREGLVAFEAMPYNPAAAAETLAALCERHGLRRAAERLRRAG